MCTLSSCELRTPACWCCRPSIRLGLYHGFEALLERLARLQPLAVRRAGRGLDLVWSERVVPVTDQAAALCLWCWWTGCTTGTGRSCPAGCRWTGFPDELLVGGAGKKALRATNRMTALARQAGKRARTA